MNKIILTDRLELTRVDIEDLENEDFVKEFHVLRSDKDATSWSLAGAAKTLDDSKKILRTFFGAPDETEAVKKHRASYVVRKRAPSDITRDLANASDDTVPIGQIIGTIGMFKPSTYGIPFPDELTLPESITARDSVLKMEMGYGFLPVAWGRGYCTETVKAFLSAYQNGPWSWSPYKAVWVQAIMGPKNPKSRRVVEKAGLTHLGIHKWDGEDVFLGGDWQKSEVSVCGKLLHFRDPKGN